MDAMDRSDAYNARSSGFLFIALVIAAYTSAFISAPSLFTPAKTAILLAAGLLYVLIGLYGADLCERSGRARAFAVYFAVQISLLALITFYLSFGGVWLLPLPLVSQSVEYFPRRWPIIVALTVAVTMGQAVLNSAQLMDYYRLVFQSLTSGGSGWSLMQSLLQYLLAVAFVVIFTQVAMRERKARAETERLALELGEANLRLRQYSAQAEDLATVKERNRLAREIHDSLGHYLTVINIQLKAARAMLKDDPARALDALGKAQILTQDGLDDVRRSVAALRASPESGPFPESITALVEGFRAGGIAASFDVHGAPRPISPQAELTLYRAVQEGLTNARKHSQAANVRVALDYSAPDTLRLVVEDDGRGSGETDGGFGLLGLRERAQLLGGQVRIQTEPGRGFRLEVELPE